MSESKTTTNHGEIREWVEKRNGKPAVVSGTEDNQDEEGMLRIMFTEESGNSLKPISWDLFFRTFEDRNLAFLFQDEIGDHQESRFFKLIRRS